MLRLQRLDDFLAHRVVEVGQDLQVEVAAQRFDELRALVAVQVLQQVGEIGLVQLGGEVAGLRRLALLQGLGDRSGEMP